MKNVNYPVILHREDKGFSAAVPDLPGCFTQGDTLDETLTMAQDAIGLYLEGLDEAPAASAPDSVEVPAGDFLVSVPFDVSACQRRHNTKAMKKGPDRTGPAE